jgi:hypothetical protein
LSDTSVTVADGKIECSFVRAVRTNLELPLELGTVEIDLSKEFFIAFAMGFLDSELTYIGPHSVQKVTDVPMTLFSA